MSEGNRRTRTLRVAALITIPLLVALFTMPAAARLMQTAAADPCSTANVLSGSNFEIDANANLKVDGASPCIDWLANGTGSALRQGVLAKTDKPTGSNDDSFGQGTSENDANPTIVTGSIPPNKSDLKVFGAFTETAASAKFLELFWSRVQSPQGTTNMDFELNQKFCDPTATPTNCANNGSGVTPETPVRTAGDKLITYDLAKGGTVPTISIRTWTGSVWGPATVISGPGGTALGSVNTSAIPAADTGGIGSQDPLTFGEAAVSFSALFPGGGACGTFGSAYLKSRSSDSFTAELKDFIAPERVQISNCTTLQTNATASVTIGSPISDTATLGGATSNAGGTITFHLFSNSTCTSEINTGLSPVPVNGNGDYGSGNFTPTAAGTYYWTANYSGDVNNAAASTSCGDANEASVVGKASPSINTSPNPSSGTIGVVLNDSAALANGFNPTGSIVFKLFGPDNATCDPNGAAAVFSETVTVSGNGTYSTTTGYTTTQAGTYHWTASYGGDANNNAAASACADEAVVVGKAPSSISTAQQLFPQDSATISASAGGTPTGSVSFKLFGPDNATCDPNGAAPVYTETVSLANGSASTSNSTFSVSSASASTYRWVVEYSGDATHEAVTSACGTEQFTLTIANS
jgi:hypothetical protein